MKYRFVVDFIRDLYKIQKEFIPLHAPVFRGNEKKYLEECIDSTFVSSVGQYVDKFEEEIAKYTGVSKAIACVNGTNALHIALKLVDVKEGDEVVTQPLTFIATCNAISYCGAKPVFVDVDLDTMGMSPKSLKKWIQENTEMRVCESSHKLQPYNINTNRRISAVVPMHTFGHPCRIDEIAEICSENNIALVEDAAESLGSFFKKKHTGSFGEVGVISFNGNKVITSGGGGMLLFNNEELAEKAKHLTTQAKLPHRWSFIHDEIAYNYRMPNINAALGLAQLEKIDEILKNKRDTAFAYQEFFRKIDNSSISFFSELEQARSNYWLNALVFKTKFERDKFLYEANDAGIMTRPIWELMNRLPMFKYCQSDNISNAEYLADRVVNITSGVK